jgi:hypothetical protein
MLITLMLMMNDALIVMLMNDVIVMLMDDVLVQDTKRASMSLAMALLYSLALCGMYVKTRCHNPSIASP